ncbi:uncharacterized protein [Amphiura filiformis]|uniref:uncharacterized protein n=1 Tax=Amphiura filiformis TaxID=82378 RepID=UPI003B21A2AA
MLACIFCGKEFELKVMCELHEEFCNVALYVSESKNTGRKSEHGEGNKDVIENTNKANLIDKESGKSVNDIGKGEHCNNEKGKEDNSHDKESGKGAEDKSEKVDKEANKADFVIDEERGQNYDDHIGSEKDAAKANNMKGKDVDMDDKESGKCVDDKIEESEAGKNMEANKANLGIDEDHGQNVDNQIERKKDAVEKVKEANLFYKESGKDVENKGDQGSEKGKEVNVSDKNDGKGVDDKKERSETGDIEEANEDGPNDRIETEEVDNEKTKEANLFENGKDVEDKIEESAKGCNEKQNKSTLIDTESGNGADRCVEESETVVEVKNEDDLIGKEIGNEEHEESAKGVEDTIESEKGNVEKEETKLSAKGSREVNDDKIEKCGNCDNEQRKKAQNLLGRGNGKGFEEMIKEHKKSDTEKGKEARPIDESENGHGEKVKSTTSDEEEEDSLLYRCTTCSLPFKNPSKLRCHMVTHSSKRTFTYKKCSNSYKRKDHLTRHRRVCMPESNVGSDEEKEETCNVERSSDIQHSDNCDNGDENGDHENLPEAVDSNDDNIQVEASTVMEDVLGDRKITGMDSVCGGSVNREVEEDKEANVSDHDEDLRKRLRRRTRRITYAENESSNDESEERMKMAADENGQTPDTNPADKKSERDKADSGEDNWIPSSESIDKSDSSDDMETEQNDGSSDEDFVPENIKEKTMLSAWVSEPDSNSNDDKIKRKFKCKKYNNTYKRKAHLTRHRRACMPDSSDDDIVPELSTRPQTFKCSRCVKSYRQQGFFNLHLRTCRKVCKHCGNKFQYMTTCEKHERLCKDTLHADEDSKEADDKTSHRCILCNVTFSKRLELLRHFSIHSEETNRCQRCGKSHNTKDERNQHQLSCTEKFSCRYCDAMFVTGREGFKHERSHEEYLYVFKCQYCGMKFKNDKSCNIHEKSGHGPVKCEICGILCDNKYALYRHNKSRHQDGYLCKFCGKSFPSRPRLQHHEMTHTEKGKKHVCDICEKGFRLRETMVYHYKTVHSDKRHFPCSKCSYRAKVKKDLKKHERTHSEDTVKCKYCDKQFKNALNLKYHEAIHTGNKRYKCSYCDARFAHPTGKYAHESTHKNEKRHECNVCHKKFNLRQHLTQHQRIHSDARPHKCTICGDGFKIGHHLTQHMDTHNKTAKRKR